MELVDVQVEVAPAGLWGVRSFHRGELELSDQEGAYKIGLLFADLALGEIGNKDPLVIHHEPGVDLALDLANNVPNRRRHEKLAHLVLNRGDLQFETVIDRHAPGNSSFYPIIESARQPPDDIQIAA